MPDGGLVEWLESRGFYALLILALVALGLLLARGRKGRSDRAGQYGGHAGLRRSRVKKDRHLP